MTQEELIARYKEKDIENDITYAKGFQYFKSALKFYKDLQDGMASEINYFENTMVLYNECDRPNRDPDFGSDSGSCYWYFKEGIIRGSDHWGCGVANCDWPLKLKEGKIIYGGYYKHARSFAKPKYGFARWEDYLFKARLIEIDGKEVVTTFNNTTGRDLLNIDGKTYMRKVIEVFEEVKDEQD